MDHAKRLIRNLCWFSFGLLLAFVAAPSFAASYTQYYLDARAVWGYLPTRAEACTNAIGRLYDGHIVSKAVPEGGTGTAYTSCGLSRTDATVSGGYRFLVNMNIQPISRTCPDGQEPNTSGVCTAPPVTCPAGEKSNWSYQSPTRLDNLCINQCQWAWTGDANGSGGYWWGQFTSEAVACGENTPGITPPPGTCPAGTKNVSTDPLLLQCQADQERPPECWVGSTNISTDPTIAICVANDTPPPKPDGTETDVTTETKADGTTTTTTTTTTRTTNEDGTQTTTTEVTNEVCKPGEVCTSTTTVGGSGESDFCQENPQLTACKDSEAKGACVNGAAQVTCTGDGVQCAIFKQQMTQYCEDRKETAEVILGRRIMRGDDPLKSQFPTSANGRVVNVGAIQPEGFLGGGACFADKTFVVVGQSFVVPFSDLCDYLIALRFVVMFAAAMAAYRIVSGAVFNRG